MTMTTLDLFLTIVFVQKSHLEDSLTFPGRFCCTMHARGFVLPPLERHFIFCSG